MHGRTGTDALGVLDRMTCVLEAFDQDDAGLGISELALRADLPKSTVSRLVATLVRQRYLERDGTLIHLGLRLFELGQLAEQPRELRAAALPVMADLRGKTGESVHVAIRDGREMVCVAAMRSGPFAPSTVRTGKRLAVHATALGKAALAHQLPSEVEEMLALELEPRTPHTITDPVELRRQLADIRRGDLAIEVGEYDEDVSCAAVAILTSSGSPVAALSISGSSEDFDADLHAPAIRCAALALGRRLASGGISSR
jgi:DNA-binding IclR family transcriptional regulator